MVLRTIASYTTMFGLTYQSAEWQVSMNAKLVQMGVEAARAAELQGASDTEFSLATETHEKAGVDRAKGEALQEEAEALYAEAEKDEALATSQEVLADEEAAKATEEEEQAVAHFSEAGALQAVVDYDTTEGVADAASASRTEAFANADEVATGVCEFVPLLDLVCDVVGGTAAVGLETAAAAEAAESAALIAAAAEAEIKEKSEVAVAAEFQSAAAADGELAAADQAAAAELEEKAEAETAEAAEEEAAAQEKLDQSTLEEEAADQEDAEAVAEQEESEASFAKSVQYGAAALTDALFAAVASIGAALFFGLRVLSQCVPVAREVIPRVATRGFSVVPVKSVSHAFHHCFIFGIALGYFGSWLNEFPSLSTRARGGIILLFALVAATSQALLVHALPQTESAATVFGSLAWTFLESLCTLFPLFILEFLILRVCFGQAMLSTGFLTMLQQWYLWVIFAGTLCAHHWFLKRRRLESCQNKSLVEVGSGDDSPPLKSSKPQSYGSVSQTSPSALESIPLVSTPQEPATRSWRDAMLSYFQQFRLPLDVLIACCAFAILRTCLPNMWRLWPASKGIILAAHPPWQFFAIGGGVTAIVIITGVACHCRKTKDSAQRQRS